MFHDEPCNVFLTFHHITVGLKLTYFIYGIIYEPREQCFDTTYCASVRSVSGQPHCKVSGLMLCQSSVTKQVRNAVGITPCMLMLFHYIFRKLETLSDDMSALQSTKELLEVELAVTR